MKWYKKNHRRTLSAAVIVRSPEAKLTLQYLNDLAAESDAAGFLLDNGRPYTVQQIVAFTGLNIKRQQLALEELQFHGLIQKRGDGAIEVLGWDEDQGPSKAALKKRTQRGTSPEIAGTVEGTCPPKNGDSGSQLSDNKEYIDTSTTTGDKSPSVVSDAPAPEWVGQLRGRVHEILSVRLDALDPAGIHTLGQYHCYAFANCTQSESSNLSNATKVAKGLAGLSQSRDYGDMTVRQYIAYAQKVHAQRKGLRWFDPWYIKAVVEFERA